jgi:hypothetical protein
MDSLPGYVRRADLFREHAGAAFLQPQLETITMGRSGETNGCV